VIPCTGKGRQTRLRGRTTSKLTEPKNRDKQQTLQYITPTQDTEEEDEPCGHLTQRDETVTQSVPTHSSPELDNTKEDRSCLPNLTSGVVRSTALTTRAVTSAKARSGVSSQQTRSQSLRRGRTAQRELPFGQENNDDPCGRKTTVTQRDKTVTQPTPTESSP
jgi:hypothetical protein